MSDESIRSLIDQRVKEFLTDMSDRPPREREALAGAVEKLLRAKPLAGEGGLDLLTMLRNLEKGPKPLEVQEDE